MIEFASLEETRIGDVVETLEAIYAETGKPVAARVIGEVVGMQGYTNQAKEHARVIVDLQAKLEPADPDEQRRILRVMDSLRARQSNAQENLGKLKKLKTGLMQDLHC